MKTKILITFILLVSYSSFSQTKEDTQNLIKQKIENATGYNKESDMYFHYTVNFIDNNMIIETKISLGADESYAILEKEIIPVNRIKTAKFIQKEIGLVLEINVCSGNNDELIKYYDSNGEFSYKQETTFLLDDNLKNDNLTQKTEEAFKHLIELYGGR